jgi:hypothetical protein
MPEHCRVLLSSLNTETPHLIEILPDMLGRDPREVNAPPFAPGEELRYGTQVSTAVCPLRILP